MAPLNRDKRVNLLVTPAEQAMLKALAEREGVTMSDYLRQYVRRQHAATFGEPPAQPSKPKARKRR